jgi:hypothetical protein
MQPGCAFGESITAATTGPDQVQITTVTPGELGKVIRSAKEGTIALANT